MARIQRKKKPGAKSPRRLNSGAAVDGAADSQVAGRRAPGKSETSGESRRRQPAAVKKTPVSLSKPQAARSKDGWLQKSLQFLREVKVELKKVTWPTRKQTLGSTAVVIVLVILIAIFLGAVDAGLSGIFRAVLR